MIKDRGWSPAALIVSGSWHVPEHYEALATSLRQVGFEEVRNPRLSTAIEKPPVPSDVNLVSDTKLIQKEVDSMADAGYKITIICHSYGGAVTSNSVDGFLLSQRRAAGYSGGVVHVVYMAAFIVTAETALMDAFGGAVPEWLQQDEKNDLLHITDHRMSFYNDLPNDEAKQWMEKCILCPLACFRDKLDSTAYDLIGHELDATYLVCQQDYRLPVFVQEGMATLLGEARRMEYIDKGHCAMLSAPDEVASIVWKAWETSKTRLAKF